MFHTYTSTRGLHGYHEEAAAPIRRTQTVLGTATERETVERALDLVAFGAEVQAGVAALAGLALESRA